MSNLAVFINAELCIGGELVERSLYVDLGTGLIVDKPNQADINSIQKFDLQDHIIAPAYLELQTNGCKGFHFTHFHDSKNYQTRLNSAARYLLATGVASFWATIPTVDATVFQKVIPELSPRTFSYGADLLGVHCEGPWLNPAKKGAHGTSISTMYDYGLILIDSSLMQWPSNTSLEDIYGGSNLPSVKMVTLAPELPDAMGLIGKLTWGKPFFDIVVSLGHSNADYKTSAFALTLGAKALTHVFNAMPPLDHREPGLAGTIASVHKPYYSIIADGIHLHSSTVSMAYRANPERCMLITDSTELAGLPDGIYPGHAQIPFEQQKKGNRVTIKGTDTLIGSCIGMDECVRNLMKFAQCTLAQAVRCATENIAEMMGLKDRGVLKSGKRADLVILDKAGNVKEVWQKGQCVCNPAESSRRSAQNTPSTSSSS